uniref:Actin-binding Rho-activating protein n=1 Tax=Paramormyrops kingsleyae TaxID=1676925 RepID=A0A3B3Q274_9TELE|nr:actin-binding Rho-activating protein [Paramormyrops kingsleyae]
MSEKVLSPEVTNQKPSAKKNIKKLRVLSTVCSLAKSWQQWVTDNEQKQANEPSGWSPSSGKQDEEKPNSKRVLSKKQTRPTSAPPSAAEYTLVSLQPLEEVNSNIPGASKIKTKQVAKSVMSSVQEKGVGIGLLTERYGKEATEDVDRMLKARGSPTRRRKCANVVSELTKGWKQVEKGRRQKEADSLEGDWACNMDTKDSSFSEVDKRSLESDITPGKPIQTGNTQDYSISKDKRDAIDTPESWVRIKRPSSTVVNRDVDETKRLSSVSKKYSPVGNLANKWQNWASQHEINQKLNPFSDEFDYQLSMSTRLHKGQEGYGRPKEGSMTAERAKRAEAHIHREIDDMCFIIRTMTEPGADGRIRVTFGELFDRYVRISDKVVGILMRARKHSKVAFEGEMLWQGQDDHVVITLLV